MRTFEGKWRVGVLLLFCALMWLAAGCEAPPEKKEGLCIGLSMDSIVVERWERELEALVAEVNALGAEMDVQIANEDAEKQERQIRYLIERRVDALIIVPSDVKGLYDALAEAEKQGIPVIAYDRLIAHPDIDLYVSFDNKGIGNGLAKTLLCALDVDGLEADSEDFPDDTERSESHAPRRLLIINGDPKDNNSLLLNQGFHESLKPYIEAGSVEILGEIWAEGWREHYAEEIVERYLDAGDTVDGIIAANDVLATGAIDVLSRRQKAGLVPVVGQDAELSACQRIVEHTQLATVYKPIYDLASTAARMAVTLAKGEKAPANDVMYNGYISVPYMKLDAYIVDELSMERLIIKSGFHRREDVYRNTPITPAETSSEGE